MINKDFYPTPTEVLDLMNVDVFDKIVYDPSAGSGNILDYALSKGASRTIATEIEPKLQAILKEKHQLIGTDFLSVVREQISHVQVIFMNPPFSKDVEHILHAFDVAPDGCEIHALCNWESLDNTFTGKRRQLASLIGNYGNSEYLGDCFKQAERRTGVEVGLVRLFKPNVDSENYDDYFTTEQDEAFGGQEGILPHNEIREIVQRYISSLKLYDEFEKIKDQMQDVNSHINMQPFSVKVNHGKEVLTKESFVVELQKRSWAYVFSKLNAEKYLTSKVKEDLNKFIETNKKYHFTMKNIFKMIDVLVGTREQVLGKALVEAVDNFTMYTHENRHNVEGWKTNLGHMIGKKIIINSIAEMNWTIGVGIKSYGMSKDKLYDLVKVLCFLTGTNYEDIPAIKYVSCDKNEDGYLTEQGNRVKEASYESKIKNVNTFFTNTWYDWGFFEFKVFKKGTMHLKFKDDKVWELLNRKYAEIKGFTLPEKL